MALRILIDTSVWLSLAQDYRNLQLLQVMKQLSDEDIIEFIVPDVVLDEIERNRPRIMKQASASQKDVFRRVKAALEQYGDGDLTDAKQSIADVEHKIAIHGDAAIDTMALVLGMVREAEKVVPSVIARSRAANRGLERRAPFASNRNGIADAVILETYAEIVEEAAGTDDTFAFVTTNTNDFSDNTADKRQPHPDIAAHFDGTRSRYATDIAEFLKQFREEQDFDGVVDELFDTMFFQDDPRLLSEVAEAIDLFWNQIWYTRHLHFMWRIEQGEVQVVDKMPDGYPYDPSKVTVQTLETAKAAGARVLAKYPGQLGPFDDFEYGMLNGKLSALRWVLGEEWDFLDT